MLVVEKGWGRELIFASTEEYCGKLLQFDFEGAKCSMHFHAKKDETWYVNKGSFKVSVIDTENTQVNHIILSKGDTWRNKPLSPHQLEALEDSSEILEVSTHDDPLDNYKIMPGDSQNDMRPR